MLALPVVAVGAWALAQATLFRLYLPHRYTYPLLAFCAIAIAVALLPTWRALWAGRHRRLGAFALLLAPPLLAYVALVVFPLGPQRPAPDLAWWVVPPLVALALAAALVRRATLGALLTGVALVAAVLALPGRVPPGQGCPRTPAMEYLASLPKDAVIAGDPHEIKCVPAAASRPVVISTQLAFSYERGYFLEGRERMHAMLRAYYGRSERALAALGPRYGATHLFVNRRSLARGSRALARGRAPLRPARARPAARRRARGARPPGPLPPLEPRAAGDLRAAVPVRTLLLALLLGLALAAPAAAAQPNVVVIETDDQTAADLAAMPETQRLIGDRGVSFENSVVSLSQCCPSRATFLTGQYAHNHEVRSAGPPFGGFNAFDDSESLAVWLERAGYSTALIGKYMNQYGKDDPGYVPPGWTDWHALLGPSTYYFWDFGMSEGGRKQRVSGDYQTDVLTARSEAFVRKGAAEDRPFFLWTTYVAPHLAGPADILVPPRFETAVPSPLFTNVFSPASMPWSPAFDEADVSDKPAAIRNRPRFGPGQTRWLETIWRKRQQALLSVDQGVRRIVRALEAAGELEDTLLVFTSDNGYMIGEHRIRESKVLPYEPSIRVPLLLRGPGIPSGATRSQLVWNGDLAPTILEAAGARAAWQTDGMSLLPFARDAAARSDRDVLLEGPPQGADGAPRFTGLRTTEELYVEYRGGEVELYDLRRRPAPAREPRRHAGRGGAAAAPGETARPAAPLLGRGLPLSGRP